MVRYSYLNCPVDTEPEHSTRRPLDRNGALLKPSDLNIHRDSHVFFGPCCLCPLVENDARNIVEAMMVMDNPKNRPVGEYVAKCARQKCGYFGQWLRVQPFNLNDAHRDKVFLERIHGRAGVPSRTYPLRRESTSSK